MSEQTKWFCIRCHAFVKDKKCNCTTSPSPWWPIQTTGMELSEQYADALGIVRPLPPETPLDLAIIGAIIADKAEIAYLRR